MIKWIGQHIWDFVSRFRNKVILEDLTESTEEYTIMVTTSGELVKSTHPMERSRLQIRNDEGSTIPAGAPLYSKGEIGGSERIKVGIADANDASKMPCIGVAEAEMNTSSTKDNFAISQGVFNTNISGFTGLSDGDILYVDDSGSTPYLTQNKSDITGSANKIQNVGIVLKTNGTICQGLLVSAIGRTNDVPNLDSGNIFYGDTGNQATTISLNSVLGWHGSTTRIKILPSDFVADDVGRPVMINDSSIGSGSVHLKTFGSASAFVCVNIPTGYKATHAMIHGSDTSQNYKVYEANINSSTVTSKSSATSIGTEADITDVTSSTTNYLLIEVLSDGETDEFYGGYVTITSV